MIVKFLDQVKLVFTYILSLQVNQRVAACQRSKNPKRAVRWHTTHLSSLLIKKDI